MTTVLNAARRHRCPVCGRDVAATGGTVEPLFRNHSDGAGHRCAMSGRPIPPPTPAEMTPRRALELVLDAHTRFTRSCRCGLSVLRIDHPAHVADEIDAAGLAVTWKDNRHA